MKERTLVMNLSRKEETDAELAIHLWNEGIITTPRKYFEASDAKEIDDLVVIGLFQLKKFNPMRNYGRIINPELSEKLKINLPCHMKNRDW